MLNWVNANKMDNLNKEICFCKYGNNYSIESDNITLFTHIFL